MRANNTEPTWSLGDKAVMAFIIGLHAFAIWRFIHVPPPEPPPELPILQVSMIIPPPDEPPPPPEPPKPPPPQPPKVIPKTPPPPVPVVQPKVVTEVPVQAPIPPPPPTPPAPPAPPPPPPKPSAPSYLAVKQTFKPVYPRKAMRDGIEGKVTVLITVDEKGIPSDAKVVKSSGNFDLDNAARTAALKYVFVPQQYNGAPVKALGLLDIVFKLNEG